MVGLGRAWSGLVGHDRAWSGMVARAWSGSLVGGGANKGISVGHMHMYYINQALI